MAIAEVIKFGGTNDMLAWKYPNSELGTWSQLIVNESQEAVLFKGGKALDVFGSGRHTLSTNNIPLLRAFVNIPFGKKSPFSAEVWFVNRTYSLDIKWGTASPVQLQDPKYGVMVPVRSYGQFGIKVEDSKKFLVKLVGTLSSFNKQSMVEYFRGLYLTKVKDTLSSYLISKKISILEINAYIDEISLLLKEKIAPTMEEYGISLANFYVNDISVPEDDSVVIKLRDALAKRAEMTIIGYDYQQERSFDTLESAAKNNASGGMMGAGLGLGMGVTMGGAVGNQFGSLVGNMDVSKKETTIKCTNCGTSFKKGAKFCPECGDKYHPCPSCGADVAMNTAKCECGYQFPLPCPHCGSEVRKGAKFCPECGGSLIVKCPKCNAELNQNKKFCPECGEKL